MWKEVTEPGDLSQAHFSAPEHEQKAAPRNLAIPPWQVALSTSNGRLQFISMFRLIPLPYPQTEWRKVVPMPMQNRNCTLHSSKVWSRQVCSAEERASRGYWNHSLSSFQEPICVLFQRVPERRERHQTYARPGATLTSWGRISYIYFCVQYSMMRSLCSTLHPEVFGSFLLFSWSGHQTQSFAHSRWALQYWVTARPLFCWDKIFLWSHG